MKSPLIAGKSQNRVEIISSEVRKETFNDYSERKYTQVGGNGSYPEKDKDIVCSA